jgi:hypothetical protein
MDYIFDIDDTLSISEYRHHLIEGSSKDWDTYFSLLIEDLPIEPTVEILRCLCAQGNRIILCTGRPEKYRKLTVDWLAKYDVPADALFMRQPSEAYLPNAEAKKIMISRIRESGYAPVAVFEDNPKSVQMWRDCGLVVLQVVR